MLALGTYFPITHVTQRSRNSLIVFHVCSFQSAKHNFIMEEISQEQLEKFVKRVVSIERKYGYELRNVTTERQQEIAKWLNKFILEEFSNDNPEN